MNIQPRGSVNSTGSAFFAMSRDVPEEPALYGEEIGCLIDPYAGDMGSGVNVERPRIPGQVSPEGDAEEADDSSLPWGHTFTQGEDGDVFATDTRNLMESYLRSYTGFKTPQREERGPVPTMRRVVGEVLARHGHAFADLVNKLPLGDGGDLTRCFSAVTDSLFSETTNWGRIVSLVAFGGVVSQRLKEEGSEDCVELVAENISVYLLSYQRDWLMENQGWDGFVEFFGEGGPDPEFLMKNQFMAVALGPVAVAALVVHNRC